MSDKVMEKSITTTLRTQKGLSEAMQGSKI